MPKRTFVYGATILLGANLINRILGFVYQYLIMTHIGGEAYGLFTMVFPVYMMALVLTTAGIPLAVSKMVSEEISLGRRTQATAVFHLSLGILTVSGAFVSVALYEVAPLLAHRLFPDPRVLNVFLICTPAIFIVSVASAFRGYFQGLQNMIPTALSQILEQIVRITFGFTLASRLLPRGVEWAAVGLALGMLSGEFMGLLAIVLQYYFGNRISFAVKESVRPLSQTLRTLFTLASPVTLGRLLATGLSAVDALLIPMRLQVAGYTAREATTLFGQLGGSAFTLLTFPSVFTFALATSLVPAISEASAQKQFHVVRARSTEAIRLTIILGLPALIILFIYAGPLTNFFKSPSIAPILRVLVFGGIFAYIQQTTTGILQGLGKVQLPVLHAIIGATVRIPLLIILTALPQWGLLGSAWAYVFGFIIMAVLNLLAIGRYTGLPLDLQHFFLQPFTGALGMFLAVRFLNTHMSQSLLNFVFQSVVGLLLYMVLLFLNGAIRFSDLRRLPWIGKYL
ncbi:MAG: putative polysaccharide biosynthesis protein [Desulfitobacteriaceae bacterium]